MIQKRLAYFQGVGHAHLIRVAQQHVGEIERKLKERVGIDWIKLPGLRLQRLRDSLWENRLGGPSAQDVAEPVRIHDAPKCAVPTQKRRAGQQSGLQLLLLAAWRQQGPDRAEGQPGRRSETRAG